MNENKVILAFLAGIAVGAGLGLVTAPDKSSETRKRLADTLKRTGSDIIDILSTGLNSAKNKFSNKMQDSIEDIVL